MDWRIAAFVVFFLVLLPGVHGTTWLAMLRRRSQAEEYLRETGMIGDEVPPPIVSDLRQVADRFGYGWLPIGIVRDHRRADLSMQHPWPPQCPRGWRIGLGCMGVDQKTVREWPSEMLTAAWAVMLARGKRPSRVAAWINKRGLAGPLVADAVVVVIALLIAGALLMLIVAVIIIVFAGGGAGLFFPGDKDSVDPYPSIRAAYTQAFEVWRNEGIKEAEKTTESQSSGVRTPEDFFMALYPFFREHYTRIGGPKVLMTPKRPFVSNDYAMAMLQWLDEYGAGVRRSAAERLARELKLG